jgi:hypothetical protein
VVQGMNTSKCVVSFLHFHEMVVGVRRCDDWEVASQRVLDLLVEVVPVIEIRPRTGLFDRRLLASLTRGSGSARSSRPGATHAIPRRGSSNAGS